MAKKHTIELKMTLLEVIALLGFAGILASILLPMMPLSPTSSDETRANSDCIQIARAITAYKADYGTLPSTNTKAMPFSGAILKTLAGDNPRNKIYYTANENDCKNPWGFSYTIQFAKDNNDVIYCETGDKVKTLVAVWTKTEKGKLIVSW